MAWERDTVPTINPQLLAELRAYLERTFQNLEAELLMIRRAVELIYTTTGITFAYLWDDTGTGQADPGSGYMRGNASNLGSVTTLWISKVSQFAGLDAGAIVDMEGQIYSVDSPDGSNYTFGRIASVTDLGTYYALALTVTAGKGNPQQADLMQLRLIPGALQ